MRAGIQSKLFDASAQMPNGLVYRPDFISEEEEWKLLAMIDTLPMRQARHQAFTGRRLLAWFDDPLPLFLEPCARRISKWLSVPRRRIAHALINDYLPGTGMGYHRDDEPVEHIVGVSLGGWATMRWRPHAKIERGYGTTLALDLEPRSAYIMQKEIRWDWQHSVAPVPARRVSITFRTLSSPF
jgi:alkylated DNA repair dioxygenase AlkB